MDFEAGPGPYGMASADFNRDAIPDLVVADYALTKNGVTASILLGRGDGTFDPRDSIATEPGVLEFVTGDLNRDGVVDLIALNQNTSIHPISVFLGNGNGTFLPRVDYGFDGNFRGSQLVSVADMDGDGNLDVVLGTTITNLAGDITCTTTAGSTTVTSNNAFFGVVPGNWVTSRGTPNPATVGIAPGTYVVSVESPSSLTISQPATASRTGIVRYVILGPNRVSIWAGDGTGALTAPTTAWDVALGGDAVVVADVNRDGWADILSTNYRSTVFGWMPGAVYVLLGKADHTFDAPLHFEAALFPTDLEVGDFNNDTYLDLATANGTGNSVSVLPGDGQGAFGSHQELPAADATGRLKAVDLDGDGVVDLAAAAFLSDGKMSVFLSDGAGGFKPRLDFQSGNQTADILAPDLNRDGRPDLVASNFSSARVTVLLNVGCRPQDAITGVFPNRGGNGGLRIVSVYGCDLPPDAGVRLTRAGEADIPGVIQGTLADGALGVLFDLTGRSLGPWDVVLARAGLPDAVRPGGFLIEEARADDIWAEWGGPVRLRLLRNFEGELFGGNLGNNDPSAGSLPLGNAGQAEATVDDCTKEFSWSFACVDDIACTDTVEIYKKDCDVEALTENGLSQTTVTIDDQDQFAKIKTGMYVWGIGVEWNTYVTGTTSPSTVTLSAPITAGKRRLKYGFPVGRFCTQDPSKTPPEGREDFCLTLPANITPNDFKIQTFYRGVARLKGSALEQDRCVHVFRAKGKGAGHPGHIIVDKYGLLYRYWERYITPKTATPWPADLDGLAENVRQELCHLLNTFETCDSLHLAKADVLIIEAVRNALEKTYSGSTDAHKKLLNVVWQQRADFQKKLCEISKDLKNWNTLIDSTGSKYAQVVPNDWSTGPKCAQYACGTAVDPNAKVGPAGAGPRGGLLRHAPLHYTIHFENEETATYPAVEVAVTDHLDPSALDFSTFRFGGLTFGDQEVTPIPGQNPYLAEVDLRPAQNLKVRIIARLDELTGQLTFRFQSVDPTTGLEPTDQSLGFLPPNRNPPEGEGSVSFFLMPRVDIFADTPIRNGATIVFDTNAPIPTNEWVNTIDVTKPSSQVSSLAAVPGHEDRVVVKWSGSDGIGSGIDKYSIYVSDNGSPYALWLETPAEQDTFPGEDGHTYGFYSIARDLVGFEEDPPTPLVADRSITVTFCQTPMAFDFTPGTLNLRSMGKWVTGYLEPPAPFTPADIDTPSVRLNGIVPADLTGPVEIGDYDRDGVSDLMVKFDRGAVDLSVSAGDSIPMTVTGMVGESCFRGTDYVRVVRAAVTAPAGGSVIHGGITTPVEWTTPAGVQIQSVAVLSSIDDGTTWDLVAHGLANTGRYDWTVPGVSTNKARVAVVLVENSDETGYIVDGVLGTSGTFSIDQVTGVGDGSRVQFALRVVRPNPTQQDLRVTFGLPEARAAKIEVFNVTGRLVASREVGSLGIGFHTVTLGGRATLASGVYIVRLTQGGKSLTTRAVLVR